MTGNVASRRAFLRFLTGSPLFAQQFSQQSGEVIADPKDALDVFDFEEVAHRKVLPGHWAYTASGVDDDATLRANRDGFTHIQLRPRRLRDATKVDMTTELFGTRYESPIFLCPTAGERSLHPDGELAVARAAKARGTMQMLSTNTSTPIEDVNAARGLPVWFQLYAPSSWDACERIIRRVEHGGCAVIALTVDNITGRNSETYLRTRPKDLRQCASCHQGAPGQSIKQSRMFDGINMAGVVRQTPTLTWDFVDRMRKATSLKLFIKGIDTREDALLAIEHGFDGILVSNHGGRATETRRSTIEALPEVIAAVGNRVPVFMDSGVRRGTDVFKALAYGAKAVGIGRPFLWGLGAFGEAGVDRVLDILQRELKLVMGNCGTLSISEIDRSYVRTPEAK